MSAFQIAIEGSDGVGKETQSKLLAQQLTTQGYRVATVSFPRYGGTWAGKLTYEALKSERAPEYKFLNASPQAASFLYAADRLESIEWLRRLIQENDVVLYDRAVASNLIHQGGKLNNDEERRQFLRFIENLEYGNGFPRPDMTLFLSLPFEISMARARARAENSGSVADVVEADESYMRRSHRSGIFYALECGWNIVEGVRGKKELTPEEIFDAVWHQVSKRIPRK